MPCEPGFSFIRPYVIGLALIFLGLRVLAPQATAEDQFLHNLPPKPDFDNWSDVKPMSSAVISEARTHSDLDLSVRYLSHGGAVEDDIVSAIQARAKADNPIALTASCFIRWQRNDHIVTFTSTMDSCRAAAEHGYGPAELLLGVMLRDPGQPQRAQESEHWLRLAAEQHEPLARLLLADSYFKGIGMPSDSAIGSELMRQVNELDPPVHDLAIYIQQKGAGNNVEAVTHLLAAAVTGSWLAELSLADSYNHGQIGFPIEPKLVQVHREQAINRFIIWLYNCVPYEDLGPQPGLDPNLTPAVSPLSVAAVEKAQGGSAIQAAFTNMTGASPSWDEISNSLRTSANVGNPVAQTAICAFWWSPAAKMSYETAEWRCFQAANQGYGPAELLLGIMLRFKNDSSSQRQSYHWLGLAASQGIEDADIVMASKYVRELGDITKGQELIKAALDHGSAANKLYALYVRYRRGVGLEVNLQRAQTYLKGAAEAGDWLAQHDYANSADDKTAGASLNEMNRRSFLGLVDFIFHWRPRGSRTN